MKTLIFLLTCLLFFACTREQMPVPCGEARLGGSDLDWFNTGTILPDGGFLLAGYASSSDQQLDQNAGSWDWWIVAVNADLELVRSWSFGTSGRDAILDMCPDGAGGYYFAGYSGANDGDTPDNKGELDVWVMRMDGQGNVLWSNTYGGSLNDEAFDVELLADGSCLVTGYTESNDYDVALQHGIADIWVLNISPTGGLNYEKTFGGSALEYGLQSAVAPDGAVYTAGYSFSADGDFPDNHSQSDAVAVRWSGQGTLDWAKSYGSTGMEYTMGIQYRNNELFLLGYHVFNASHTDVALRVLDTDGNLLSQETFGDGDKMIPFSLIPAADGGWRVTGYREYSAATGQAGEKQGFVALLMPDGTPITTQLYGPTGDDLLLTLPAGQERFAVGMSASGSGHGAGDGWIKCIEHE